MNASGFRACVKELYGTRYDPLSVSYAVLTGLLILVTVFIYWVCPPYVLTNEAYQQINLKTIRLLIHLRFFFFWRIFHRQGCNTLLKFKASGIEQTFKKFVLLANSLLRSDLSSVWVAPLQLLRKSFYFRSFSYQPCNSTATEVPLRLIYTYVFFYLFVFYTKME